MEITYTDAVTRLNGRNVDSLLTLSALFSSIEYFLGDESPVCPLLNFESVRLFADAILESKAASYKPRKLEPAELPYVLNGLGHALIDQRLKKEVRSGEDRKLMLYNLVRFFSRQANIQLRQQKFSAWSTTGRIVNLLVGIPSRQPNKLPRRFRSYQDRISEALGTGLHDLALIYLMTGLHYKGIAESSIAKVQQRVRPQRPMEDRRHRQASLLTEFVSIGRVMESELVFSSAQLNAQFQNS